MLIKLMLISAKLLSANQIANYDMYWEKFIYAVILLPQTINFTFEK